MVMAKIHAAVRMISRFDRDSLIFCTCLLPAVRAGLLARFLLTGLGWWGARKIERSSSAMCDFSLHNVKSRPAKVGDKLTTHNFNTGTRGFATPEDSTTAVCILPGTELAFSWEVMCAPSGMLGWKPRTINFTTAIF